MSPMPRHSSPSLSHSPTLLPSFSHSSALGATAPPLSPPQIYKRLCYPFMMSRSSLHAVGAPHTWPHLLAALVWLCELLVYEQRAAEAKKAGRRGQEDDDMNEVFFEYVTRSYQHFLAGDDALCAALDKELARRFEDRSKAMSTRTQELDAENARLR